MVFGGRALTDKIRTGTGFNTAPIVGSSRAIFGAVTLCTGFNAVQVMWKGIGFGAF